MRQSWEQTERAIADTWTKFTTHWEAGDTDQYGTFSQTWTDLSGKASPQKGRFIAQFRRESDGVWRVNHMMFTDIPAE